MLGEGIPANASLAACPIVSCAFSCVLAVDEYAVAASLAFPTPEPYYVTSPQRNSSSAPQDRVSGKLHPPQSYYRRGCRQFLSIKDCFFVQIDFYQF